MSDQPAAAATAPPEIIYIIRHSEKPADPQAADPGQPTPAPAAPFGVDDQGNHNPHSLLPRGWQRRRVPRGVSPRVLNLGTRVCHGRREARDGLQ